ncbi:glycosyltransferase family 2 protein [Pseudooceanicola sp. CBS1P-1]|uniref:Glycosyltransferase family 2 protein n=1 Tax=Pseudooceanicola albus TaxID=2692189 RepID=A0A6L7G0G9_9RHOB|nr:MULTISPECIES: glycosyltransferase family 2 protein [Pseudooceanicola]MBT9382479.1 glycosyltransferase family 2 protein [Pseudooceanicola endophyticus]MXN17020.1 glycosyltransferase family 2 protein [Pseudooceanicola albus]
MRITAVTCVKNEGPFLLEWIAWQRLIGVTGLLVYSNDCSDGTDRLLDGLAAHGVLHHLPNPASGRNYQMEALKACRQEALVRQADWVWIADVDEFLNIHTGDHTIPALIAACGDPQAISVHFQFFGNDGVTRFEDRPVIAQFTRCHDPDIWNGQLAIEVKTLVRRDFPLRYYGAHRPFFGKGLAAAQRPRWCDGSGRAVPQRFLMAANPRRIRRFPARGARHHATLNHYALRSLDSYLVKTDRGDVNRAHRAFDDSYWRERADTAWQDLSIRRLLPALEAGIAKLKALPGIAALHEAAVAAHRARAGALLAQEGPRQLAAQLRRSPPLPEAETALLVRLGVPPEAVATGAFR